MPFVTKEFLGACGELLEIAAEDLDHWQGALIEGQDDDEIESANFREEWLGEFAKQLDLYLKQED